MEQTTNIEKAAAEAVRVIAKAAEEATKVVANAAAESVKVVNVKNDGDHDLLITFRAESQIMMGGLKDDIKELKTGTQQQIVDLKATVTTCNFDHETRLNKLETTSTRQTVTLALSGTALTILIGLLLKHMFS